MPKDATLRQRRVETVGQDGYALLTALRDAGTPPEVLQRPAIQTLRTVWLQQYSGPHDVRWRSAADLPPHAHLLTSPDDVAARFATKRQTSWTGDTVHLTATGDEDGPHLITNVETTPATTNDVDGTDTIHAQLAARDLLPAEHLLNTGSGAADILVARQQQQVDVLGPVLRDTRWQAQQPDGLDVSCFALDGEARQAVCLAGKVRVSWVATHDRPGAGQDIVAIQFDPRDCQACPLRPRCTQAQKGGRNLRLRPREQHEALQSARQRQVTEVAGAVCRARRD